MEILIRSAVLALLVAGAACEFVPPPTFIETPRDRLIVHSVLSAGSDTVKVLLTIPAPKWSADYNPLRVGGATVRLSGGGREVTLLEAPAGFSDCTAPSNFGSPGPQQLGAVQLGCYAAVLPGGVLHATRYTLRVEAPGREVVTGETLVPTEPEWISFPEQHAVQVSWSSGSALSLPLELRWRTAAAATEIPPVWTERIFRGGRQIEGRCVMVPIRSDGTLFTTNSARTDSVQIRILLANCRSADASPGQPLLQPDSAYASILLSAYDQSYAAHAQDRARGSSSTRSASPGLSGAYGVFGSVAIQAKRLVLIASGS
ncbi:hypothetical protein BH23GEM6_BH23GEM6_21690 [soil metagenome]